MDLLFGTKRGTQFITVLINFIGHNSVLRIVIVCTNDCKLDKKNSPLYYEPLLMARSERIASYLRSFFFLLSVFFFFNEQSKNRSIVLHKILHSTE